MGEDIKILVVDDEQIVLDSIAKHLRKEPYEVIGVLTAQEGLDLIRSDDIDIVLTDLMMPEIDGLELMKMVKDDHPSMPVVMITGYATINTALQATQLGAFDYIAKPFSKKELLAVVHRAVDVVRAKGSGSEPGEKSEHSGSPRIGDPRTIGDRSWLMLEDDGMVLLGVERSFIQTIGRIQTVYLPSVGDEIRQGSVYLQIFSTDLRSHNVLSPLSGNVVDVNQKVIDDPATALEDPYGDGWLIRLKPSKFEFEIKELGL